MTEKRNEVQVYEDTAGEFRWRKIGLNGSDIVADSGESYTRRGDAREAAERENPYAHITDTDTVEAPPVGPPGEDLPPDE